MNPASAFALEKFLPHRFGRFAETVSRDFSNLYKQRYGLTHPEWRSFATIGQFRETTATGIVRHSCMHKTKVSRAIASLEAREWVQRNTSISDRRIEIVSLTSKGAAVFEELVGLALEYEKWLLENFASGDISVIKDALARLEARLGIAGDQTQV